MSSDSTGKTIGVALGLCVVCSVLVSTAAVKLKPIQDENKKIDVQKNLLLSTGLLKSGAATKAEIESTYTKSVETKMVDLATGEVTDKDPASFQLGATDKDPAAAQAIPAAEDIASIKTRAAVRPVYFIKENGQVSQIVLPIHGKGLWSTMYGFLALAPDTRTVKGIGFYSHGETPGLGGEIENPKWQALWKGKHVLSAEDFEPVFAVIKGTVGEGTPAADTKVDGLSGATLTSKGVQSTINYWVGQAGYGKFLANLRNGGLL
jgi:Na+-transporting NADH:ubiquinone oxidoreductase subunit C